MLLTPRPLPGNYQQGAGARQMLQIYNDHGEVSLRLTVHGLPRGFQVVWVEYADGAVLSHSQQSFPSREETWIFVRDFLRGRPGKVPTRR